MTIVALSLTTFLLSQMPPPPPPPGTPPPPPVSQSDSDHHEDANDEDAVSGVADAGHRAIAEQRARDLVASGQKRLDNHDARGALVVFDQALREDPDSVEARQGKARALILLGDAAGSVGNYRAQARDYRLAVETDPSLADDQSFVEKYDQSQQRGQRPPRYYRRDNRPYYYAHLDPPREGKWLGFNLDSGLETVVGVGITALLFQRVMVTADFDTIYPAFDIDGKFIFLKSHWSPYAGVGGHFSFDRVDQPSDLWYHDYLHFEVGAQYFSQTGFYLNLGLTWVPPIPDGVANSDVVFFPFPHIQMGWVFDFGR